MAASARAPEGVRHVTVEAAREGQRLDNFLLRELKGVPKSHVYRLLRQGQVRVNGSRAKADRRLEMGDVVRLPPVRSAPAKPKLEGGAGFAWLKERILYEDADLLVLDKPAGLPVHAGSGAAVGVIEALRALRPEDPMLELVHRLDRDTSGCLMLAKSRAALLTLHRMLREGEVRKHYLALLKGRLKSVREVTAALAADRRSGERRMRAGEEGKEAMSRIVPKAPAGPATLAEIELFTGRTHQARAHSAHIDHPIAGDDKYGDWDFNRVLRAQGLKRLFLHAARLELRHPVSGERLRFESPLPADLETVLQRLSSWRATTT